MLRRAARAIRAQLRIPLRARRNRIRLAALQHQQSLRLHLGCGDDRLPDFINIDYRPTAAADIAMDLTLPPLTAGSVSLAFSNAFFEHLYRSKRVPHLQRIRRALAPDGACCYIGMPYFPNVARLYLERGPGTAGPVFDLYNVYRYTHGAPEGQEAWWLGQLHKSLFDETEMSGLLSVSGFSDYVMFCYGYPGDANEVPVTMGFYATAHLLPETDLRQRGRALLAGFADTRIRLATLEWLPRAAAPGVDINHGANLRI
jgi:predicted SAM-dependent methyltransferase